MSPFKPHLVVPATGNEIVLGCGGHDVIVVAVYHQIMFEDGVFGNVAIIVVTVNHQVLLQVLSVFLPHCRIVGDNQQLRVVVALP